MRQRARVAYLPSNRGSSIHVRYSKSKWSVRTDVGHALLYSKGFAVSCALQFVGALAAVILTVRSSAATVVCVAVAYIHCVRKISYRNDNKRRDEKYGKPVQDEPVDTSEFADKVRYVDYLSFSGRSCSYAGPGVPLCSVMILPWTA